MWYLEYSLRGASGSILPDLPVTSIKSVVFFHFIFKPFLPSKQCLKHKPCMHVCLVVQYVWLFAPYGLSLSGFFVHGIFQARILEWVAISSRGSLLCRDQTHVSCIAGGIFTTEPPGKSQHRLDCFLNKYCLLEFFLLDSLICPLNGMFVILMRSILLLSLILFHKCYIRFYGFPSKYLYNMTIPNTPYLKFHVYF